MAKKKKFVAKPTKAETTIILDAAHAQYAIIDAVRAASIGREMTKRGIPAAAFTPKKVVEKMSRAAAAIDKLAKALVLVRASYCDETGEM